MSGKGIFIVILLCAM